ncbi:MAG: undecaprenyldiphospho-muramoylpentapeptide beta-N-acetylglucosaminyltransferase [Elusimicrobia bacterium]|nr:undecaprenyldiphospho-muramoylpentapeptide beta-N-acetylglucosaminyltransferase [Elusimicrobiota bacterium]
MVENKRVIIASGGTGGHFYPGFALAVELRSRGWQVLFLVKKDDIARPALDETDFPYAELDMTALPRSLNPLAHASFLVKLLRSLTLAMRAAEDFAPAAVFGTGSYVAFPAALAARLKGIPVFIHESNAKLGLGNRLAGSFCRKVALGLPSSDNPFAGRTVLSGTPIRADFGDARNAAGARKALGLEPGRFTALVFGGSQGARRLNAAFISAARQLRSDVQAIHLTGRRNFSEVKAAYAAAGMESWNGLRLFDYREDMPALYAAADLVISRSGASTVAELVQLEKPSILVPLPSSAGGHQKANALVLSSAGAAVRVDEGDDFDARLTAAIRNFIGNPANIREMKDSFARAGVPKGLGAAAALADLLESETIRRRT